MIAYRYTSQGEPLRYCPSCHQDLTEPSGVLVDIIDANQTFGLACCLDSNGGLSDKYGYIANGHHSLTCCGRCVEPLINHDDVIEEREN